MYCNIIVINFESTLEDVETTVEAYKYTQDPPFRVTLGIKPLKEPIIMKHFLILKLE